MFLMNLKIASLKVEDAVGIFPGEPPFSAPPRQPESLIACTKYSFLFGYVNGKVQNIRVPRDPPLPCVNLVRGFLNGFSMSIKNQKEYELQEDGIGGECHTRYVIRDDRRSSTVLVSRTKDSNNCRNKVERSIGTFFIHRNPNYLLQNRMIQGTEAFTFKLKYNPAGANAQIMQVDAEQVYQLSPFSGAEGAGVMKATQRLTLTEVTNDHVQMPQLQLRSIDIRYEFPEVLPQMLIRTGDVKQQIEELLVQLDRMPQDIREDNAHKYLQLSQLLRYLNLENLHLLYNKFSNKPNARNAFLIGVASVGTIESLTFIKEKVVKDELHELELYWIMSLALHSAKPNVDKAEEIADVLTPLHDFLTEATRENNENKIILALKAIGNAAQPASLRLVKNVIDSNRFSEYLQAIAVQTMARIGKQEPTKVQGILLQIFADPSYNVTVRMMACIGLFETNPGIPTVTAIANVLLKENNLQLVNFAYSHMKAWSNVRIPLYYSL
nr:vitellogenin-2-like [Zootoca vivipara]